MNELSRFRSRDALISLVLAGFSLSASADFVFPFSSTLLVEGFAVNPSAEHPGVHRDSIGTGPISDDAPDTVGLNTARGTAAVDALGLHASAVVHGATTNAFATAQARATANLVNPFILVPREGFTGATALVRIPFSFGGTLNAFPSIQDCPSCFSLSEGRLTVDGMVDQLFVQGVASLGTINNANSAVGGFSRSGVLEGLLPVNTELYLRAGLLTQVHCQSDTVADCGAEALFAGTLSYTGTSPDAVDFVWGLTPTLAAAVPLPAAWFLFAAGVAGLARATRRPAN